MNKLNKIIITGIVATLLLVFPALNAHADTVETLSFDLHGTVHQLGELIDGLVVEAPETGWNLEIIAPEMFAVTAYHTADVIWSEAVTSAPVDRQVISLQVLEDGRLFIELAVNPTSPNPGENSVGWAPVENRGVLLALTYTLTLNDEFTFVQSDVVIRDEESRFGHGSHVAMDYRYFVPNVEGNRPLIVWLHGIGDGTATQSTEDGLVPLLGHRGAINLASDESQAIFGGAYVLVPQSRNMWVFGTSPSMIVELVQEFAATHNVDTDRIYLAGASIGAVGALRTVMYAPYMFAAVIPACVAFDNWTNAELAAITTPTWIVNAITCHGHAASNQRAADHIPNAIHTAFTELRVPGVDRELNGHYAWLLFGNNLPQYNGLSLFEWTAGQTLLENVVPTANVSQRPGNTNDLTITVTEYLRGGHTRVVTETIEIRNNASGTYNVGDFRVFVNTQGNTQIREIRLVD